MADSGWIKLHRKIKDHWLWTEKRKFSKYEAWTDLILAANHEPGEKFMNGQVVKISRGQFITSELKLADKWGWDRKTVRKFLSVLENEKMLHKISTTHWTTVTIENYDIYQSEGTTKRTAKGQQNGQPWDSSVDTNKNVKNEKKEKIIVCADRVKMTEAEHQKLIERFGVDGTKERITKLDLYKGSTGKKYDSDYLTILSWERKEQNPNPPPQKPRQVFLE